MTRQKRPLSPLPAVLVLLAPSFLALPAASSAEWPQWRGPRRDGVSDEKGFLQSWPAGGPRIVWKAKGAGGGYSAVTGAGGEGFTQGGRQDGSCIVAVHGASGNTGC